MSKLRSAERAWEPPDLEEVRPWIEANSGPIVSLREVKRWPLSLVLRVETAGGSCYFKALPPLFAIEVTILPLLEASHPRQVPRVLARDVRRRWLLLADCGDVTLEGVAHSVWDRAVLE